MECRCKLASDLLRRPAHALLRRPAHVPLRRRVRVLLCRPAHALLRKHARALGGRAFEICDVLAYVARVQAHGYAWPELIASGVEVLRVVVRR